LTLPPQRSRMLLHPTLLKAPPQPPRNKHQKKRKKKKKVLYHPSMGPIYKLIYEETFKAIYFPSFEVVLERDHPMPFYWKLAPSSSLSLSFLPGSAQDTHHHLIRCSFSHKLVPLSDLQHSPCLRMKVLRLPSAERRDLVLFLRACSVSTLSLRSSAIICCFLCSADPCASKDLKQL
jgi:hypothetical protein